jgi:hypothetical protein
MFPQGEARSFLSQRAQRCLSREAAMLLPLMWLRKKKLDRLLVRIIEESKARDPAV